LCIKSGGWSHWERYFKSIRFDVPDEIRFVIIRTRRTEYDGRRRRSFVCVVFYLIIIKKLYAYLLLLHLIIIHYFFYINYCCPFILLLKEFFKKFQKQRTEAIDLQTKNAFLMLRSLYGVLIGINTNINTTNINTSLKNISHLC